jgi:hypothetical protein
LIKTLARDRRRLIVKFGSVSARRNNEQRWILGHAIPSCVRRIAVTGVSPVGASTQDLTPKMREAAVEYPITHA